MDASEEKQSKEENEELTPNALNLQIVKTSKNFNKSFTSLLDGEKIIVSNVVQYESDSSSLEEKDPLPKTEAVCENADEKEADDNKSAKKEGAVRAKRKPDAVKKPAVSNNSRSRVKIVKSSNKKIGKKVSTDKRVSAIDKLVVKNQNVENISVEKSKPRLQINKLVCLLFSKYQFLIYKIINT